MSEARKLLVENGISEQSVRGTCFDDSYAGRLVQKWSKYPVKGGTMNFLEGIRKGHDQDVMAMVMENQASFMMEDTLSTSVGTFTKYALPVVRRLYSNMILPQIATVQPVSGPTGLMLTMGYTYDDAKGSKMPFTAIPNQPYQANYEGMLSAGDEAVKNFAVNYSNEHNEYDPVCSDTGVGQATQNSTLANCRAINRQWGNIRPPGTSGQVTYSVKAYCRTVEGGGSNRILTLDPTLATSNLLDQNGNICGTCNTTTGAWTVNAVLAGGGASTFASNTVIYFEYWSNFESVAQETGAKVPAMSMGITQYTINAKPWALHCGWSLEAQLIMKAQYDMNVEEEVVNMMSNEVALNIDREGINEMIAGARHTATYAFSATYPGNLETIQSFQMMIDAVSAAIQRTSHRGPATFSVMGPAAWGLLKQLGNHRDYDRGVNIVVQPSHGPITSDYGIQFAGTLNGMNVYVNSFQDQTKVLVGYKGNSWLDAGFGYAPWIPLRLTDTLMTPSLLRSEKAIVTYGALKMLRSEYYGVITVSGLPTVVTAP